MDNRRASRARRKLDGMYRTLENVYGPQGWWPADDRFEVIVGAILTQNTSWANVTRAIDNLKRARALSPQALSRLPVGRLAEIIRPAGYYRQKARKLKEFLAFLFQVSGGSLDRLFTEEQPGLREKLLGVWGIGPETADSILLYAGRYPIFVVDAYTLRIFRCQGLIPAGAGYDDAQRLVMEQMENEEPFFNEFHALLVKLGNTHCRKKPRCEACPLRPGRGRKKG